MLKVWGRGAHSFLACSRARACPKWNRSKMPAGHQADLLGAQANRWCRPLRQGWCRG